MSQVQVNEVHCCPQVLQHFNGIHKVFTDFLIQTFSKKILGNGNFLSSDVFIQAFIKIDGFSFVRCEVHGVMATHRCGEKRQVLHIPGKGPHLIQGGSEGGDAIS